MSVTIRLQNLPWSANAADIRAFFKGLMIPEGGVHIIGGENGDAFIAFSSDEDARQAMMLNGGKLKGTQVSLYLSSRTEMQKTIEQVRLASTKVLAKKAPTIPTAPVIPKAALSAVATSMNQFANTGMPSANLVNPPQPPVISVLSYLSQHMQQPPQSVAVTQPQQFSAYQTMPTIPHFNNGMSSAAMGMSANYAAAKEPPQNNLDSVAAYYTAMNPINPKNPIAAGLNAMQQSQTATSAAYNTDPRNTGIRNTGRNVDPRAAGRSDSRERKIYRSRSPERMSSRQSRSNSRDRYTDSDKEGRDNVRRRTRFSAAVDKVEVPSMSSLPGASNNFSNNQPAAAYGIWENPPPQVFANVSSGQMKALNTVANFNLNNVQALGNAQALGSLLPAFATNSNPQPTRNYQIESSTGSSSSFGDIGTCVKVGNLDKGTSYSDLRKFFNGLQIGNNDIKFVLDAKNNRTGVAVVRFLTSDSKKKALTKTMWQLNSTQLIITSITEEDFESGMANVRNGNQNMNRNDGRFGSRNDRMRDRSHSRERDDYNNRGGRGNRYDDRQQNNHRGGDGGNFRQRDFNRYPRNDRNQESEERPKEYMPDDIFKVLIVDDIPRSVTEQELSMAYPNIVSVTIERNKAFIRFSSHEAAKSVLNDKSSHFINQKKVFLEPGSEAQFNDIANKFRKYDNPEFRGSGNGNSDCQFNGELDHDDNSRDSTRKGFESRDPRQRNFSNERNSDRSNGPLNQPKTDCIIMKGMTLSTNIEDVECFFKDIGINKMRVHILLDKQGKPCGDCFVEFTFPNDSYQAISKNNSMLNGNRVQVMLIPRVQVEAVLSSFNDDSSSRPPQNRNDGPPNRFDQNRNDWAPPDDFGSPGCIVMISNLSYRASVDDLLEEFREFELHPDQVIRRYNEKDQPTGKACISFNSPEDADMAIEKYNSANINGRPIWLKRF